MDNWINGKGKFLLRLIHLIQKSNTPYQKNKKNKSLDNEHF